MSLLWLLLLPLVICCCGLKFSQWAYLCGWYRRNFSEPTMSPEGALIMLKEWRKLHTEAPSLGLIVGAIYDRDDAMAMELFHNCGRMVMSENRRLKDAAD